MDWNDYLKADSISWLLEANLPGVRYLVLRDLLDRPKDDPDLKTAKASAFSEGPIAKILENMHEAGYWVVPGAGYGKKYSSTVWALISLAQLGASVEDERIKKACDYYMEHAFLPGGQISSNGAPSGTIDCLQGNLCWSLVTMGYDDPRLETAYDWMARTVTGEGIASASDRQADVRYYAYKCGPLFACGPNNKMPCAWGGIKVMLAFSAWPKSHWTPLIEKAVHQGAEFLLNGNPAKANYPNGMNQKPSQNWWKFGFPVFYVTDLLQNVEALVGLGYGSDPRLAEALSLISEKQDSEGRWQLEYDYAGKTWVDYGHKKQPNPWVTLRALRVLKTAYSS